MAQNKQTRNHGIMTLYVQEAEHTKSFLFKKIKYNWVTNSYEC